MKVAYLDNGEQSYVFFAFWDKDNWHYYVSNRKGNKWFDIVSESVDVKLINSDLSGYLLNSAKNEIIYKLASELISTYETNLCDAPEQFFVALDNQLRVNYGEAVSRLKIPPFDAILSRSSYPIANDHSDEFYFCPNCFEANKPLHEYDEAIRCENCETMYNIIPLQAVLPT